MGALRDVDPVAIARAALMADQALSALLGGPGRVGDAVGPDNEPPYPRLRLTDPPGDDRGLTHLIAPLLQVEALGDLDGSPGKPALRALLYDALQVLVAIPTVPTLPGQPVITRVVSTGGGGWSPLPNGQPRYLATVRLYGHPAPTPPPA